MYLWKKKCRKKPSHCAICERFSLEFFLFVHYKCKQHFCFSYMKCPDSYYTVLHGTFSPWVRTRTLEASCVEDSVTELSSQSSGIKGHQMTRWYSVGMVPRGRVIFRSKCTLNLIKDILILNFGNYKILIDYLHCKFHIFFSRSL